MDVVAEHRRAPGVIVKSSREGIASIENVVPQDQRHGIPGDKRLRNEKRLGDTLRARLLPVLDGQTPFCSVPPATGETAAGPAAWK